MFKDLTKVKLQNGVFTEASKAPGFSIIDFFNRIFEYYHIPFAPKCCSIDPTNLPVRKNKTDDTLEYFDDETRQWTIIDIGGDNFNEITIYSAPASNTTLEFAALAYHVEHVIVDGSAGNVSVKLAAAFEFETTTTTPKEVNVFSMGGVVTVSIMGDGTISGRSSVEVHKDECATFISNGQEWLLKSIAKQRSRIKSVTSTYSASTEDDILICSSGSYNVQLPSDVEDGYQIIIKNAEMGGSISIVSTNGLIDGNISINLDYPESVTLVFLTDSWNLI